MDFEYTEKYLKERSDLILKNMTGPNPMRLSEELSSYLPINSGSRILDLGCGAGLSSILLTDKYNAQVFAGDLWVSPTANYKRFSRLNFDSIIPLFLDVEKSLPFAEEYFDIIFCIDAYHYFGYNDKMLPMLASFVKPGGYIAVAVPGIKREFPDGPPEELKPFWINNMNFYAIDTWKNLWEKRKEIEIVSCREMECHDLAWRDWLSTPNAYAQYDVEMMKAENGQYFNHIQIIAKKI